MTTVLYPGSFDPITNGHLDIVARAAALFNEVIIGVYDTPEKNLLFTTEERVELARQATTKWTNVRVEFYSTLTVEFARKIGARSIVRGLRASSDFEREFDMAMMNKKLAPDLDLVCLLASPQYQFLSSSLLKEVARLGGCLTDLVPERVAAMLRKKFFNPSSP